MIRLTCTFTVARTLYVLYIRPTFTCDFVRYLFTLYLLRIRLRVAFAWHVLRLRIPSVGVFCNYVHVYIVSHTLYVKVWRVTVTVYVIRVRVRVRITFTFKAYVKRMPTCYVGVYAYAYMLRVR